MANHTISQLEAVERDLSEFSERAQTSSLAESARILGRLLDSRVSTRDISSIMKELREIFDALRLLYPPVKADDVVDELNKKRSARRKRTTKSA